VPGLGTPILLWVLGGAIAAFGLFVLRACGGRASRSRDSCGPLRPRRRARGIAKTHRLGIASSKPVAFSEPILRTLGIRDDFDVVAGPDLNPFGETKAATIATALETVGRPAVMVGDRRHDVEGAHANAIPCVGVTWGIGSRAELAGADAIVARPAELADALRYPAAPA
jgi:phosphoglycolate phosphatase-like HAD superfamily hydrolase